MNAPAKAKGGGTAVEPLLSVADVGRALGCGRRTIERLLAAGKFPRPDVRVGRLPRWKAATVNGWIAEGGSQ